MDEIFKKISSYNLFNYLLPGIIFALLIQNFIGYKIIQKDIILGLFLYYFVGLVISRVGSLVVGPFLKWINFLNFSDYHDYMEACKLDFYLILELVMAFHQLKIFSYLSQRRDHLKL